MLEGRLAKEKGDARARTVLLLGQTREQLGARAFGRGDTAGASQDFFSALGWYRLAVEENPGTEWRHSAVFAYLNVANQIGLYFAHEMVVRLRALAKDLPNDPAVAYMLAVHTVDIQPNGTIGGNPQEGLQLAYRAAKVARDAVKDPLHPHDPHGRLWRPHLLAALCAKVLKHGPAMRKSAEAGGAAGGPRDAFKDYLPEEKTK